MIPKREAQRLRRLLQRRLRQFEARLRQGEGDASEDVAAAPPPAELEREAKALMALMKALQTAAEMEEGGNTSRGQSSNQEREPHAGEADASLRRRLAQQLEALCAQTRPPRRGSGAG